ncbi:AAA family ATPase [Aquimarina muelleri]|uniref:AAA family ATPase n=1 Tax=Aquimarina muelleri TaxID=279356 RepID=UPI003F685812
MTLWKLGCRWGKKAEKTPSFYNFIKEQKIVISWFDKKFSINDWILIADGHTVLAFAKVLESPFPCISKPEFETEFNHLKIPFEENLIIAKADWIVLKKPDQFIYKLQQGIRKIDNKETKDNFKRLLKKYTMSSQNDAIIKLLKHKKQIILQGPPGTGKTRLAKEIASELTNSKQDFLSNSYIQHKLQNIDVLDSSSGETKYKIESIDLEKCKVYLTSTGALYDVSYEGIRKAYKKKLWEKGKQKGGLDPYNAAISKYLYDHKEIDNNKIKNYAIIQFHPSYTYEDFVRGIVIKNDNSGIEYVTENKILGQLAKEANDNYLNSKKDASILSKEQWIKQQFESFKDYVIDEMNDDGKYPLNTTVNIISIEGNAFRYTGNTWKNEFRMKYSDILYLFENNIIDRSDIKHQENINPLARTHATYFKLLLDDFSSFMKDKKVPSKQVANVKEENYVLIIDEINRANLPSVLGELIYAMEYRGKAVKSMYTIENDNELILPPNFYIIGTMNTADRSVGHIDYAIRRRFAFLNILPDAKIIEDVIENPNIKEASLKLFNTVETLFNEDSSNDNTYLQNGFRKKDVQIGHSYFLAESKEELELKLKYEIKPILFEYIKDGILSIESESIINSMSCN